MDLTSLVRFLSCIGHSGPGQNWRGSTDLYTVVRVESKFNFERKGQRMKGGESEQIHETEKDKTRFCMC